MSERTESNGRTIRIGDNTVNHEPGLDYVDGYHVTVGWSEEDNAWIARCSGTSAGEVLADGVSREYALLDLAISLAATIDAVNEPPSSPSDLLTAGQVAQRLNISEQTLANWRATGRYADALPHVKIGGTVRYRADVVERARQEGVMDK